LSWDRRLPAGQPARARTAVMAHASVATGAGGQPAVPATAAADFSQTLLCRMPSIAVMYGAGQKRAKVSLGKQPKTPSLSDSRGARIRATHP